MGSFEGDNSAEQTSERLKKEETLTEYKKQLFDWVETVFNSVGHGVFLDTARNGFTAFLNYMDEHYEDTKEVENEVQAFRLLHDETETTTNCFCKSNLVKLSDIASRHCYSKRKVLPPALQGLMEHCYPTKETLAESQWSDCIRIMNQRVRYVGLSVDDAQKWEEDFSNLISDFRTNHVRWVIPEHPRRTRFV